MGSTQKWTVGFRNGDGVIRKLFKIMFGSDGSLYVTVPYFKDRRAFLGKLLVDYTKADIEWSLDDLPEVAVLDGDDARLKLSHHVDGFIQFSGQGVISGKDTFTGKPRGLGVTSFPLTRPIEGPTFGVSCIDLTSFDALDQEPDDGTVLFDVDDLDPGPEDNGITFEGYYFARPMGRFLSRDWRARRVLRIAHPSGGILELPVCLSENTAKLPGIVGLEVKSTFVEFDQPAGYFMSSSTGDNYYDADGHYRGLQLFASCPIDLRQAATARRLDYRPETRKPRK